MDNFELFNHPKKLFLIGGATKNNLARTRGLELTRNEVFGTNRDP